MTPYLNSGTRLTAQTTTTLLSPATHIWNLNDGASGTVGTAADTGSAGHLPLSGAPGITWNTGDQFSPDVNFNGASAPMNTTGPALNFGSNDMTVSMWAKPAQLGGVMMSQDGAHSAGMIIYPDGFTGKWYFCLSVSDANTWSYNCADGAAVQLNTWAQVTGTYSASSGTMTLYVNGVAVGTAGHTAVSGFTGPLRLGTYLYDSALQGLYTGQLADVQVWNSVQPPAPAAPTVSMTSPSANATISGSTTLTATASDSTAGAATSVQFYVDGNAVGSPATSAPYSTTFNASNLIGGPHTVTAVATAGLDGATVSTTSASVPVTVPIAVAAPTVSVTSPTANATVIGGNTLTATAADSTPGAALSVQFYVDGSAVGTPVTSAPYSTTLDTSKLINGAHTVTAVATAGLNGAASSTTSSGVPITTQAAPDAPTVSVTSPASGAIVSGTTALTATAADSTSGVALSVQFYLDGNAVGNPLTSAPYSTTINTSTLSGGAHTVTAVATAGLNGAASSTTSAGVPITVGVAPPAPTHQWLLNEGTGSTTFKDSVGTLNGDVSSTGATWGARGSQPDLSLDGNSGYAETNGNAVNTGGSFTVSAWAELTSTPSTSANYTAVSELGTNNSPFYLQCNSGNWAFAISSNDTTSPTINGPNGTALVTANTWYHITGVYDASSQTAYIYVNGTLAGSQSGLPTWSAPGDLDIGRDLYTGLQVDYFPGQISDVETWNSALSATQVSALG